MAEEVEFILKFNDDEVINGMQNVITQSEQVKNSIDDINESTGQIGKEAEEAGKKTTKEFEGLNNSIMKAKNSTLAWVDSINVGGVSLGRLRQGLNNVIDGLKGAGASMLNFVKSVKAGNIAIGGTVQKLKLLTKAIVGTGVGVLVLALGQLVVYLTSTQRGIDKVDRALAGLKAGFDVIIDRIANAGGAFKALFSGDIVNAMVEFQKVFKGIGEEIKTETQLAVELERRRQNLIVATREWSKTEANLRAEFEEQRFIAEDTTKTFEERRSAGLRALEIQKQIEEESTKLAQERLDIITEQNNLGESLNADLEAQAEAEIELSRIRQEASARSKEVRNQLNALTKEELAQVKALNDAYLTLSNSLEKTFTDARINLLTGTDKVFAEYEKALGLIDEFDKASREQLKALGQGLPEGYEEGVEALKQGAFNDYKKAIDDLRKDSQVTANVQLGSDKKAQEDFKENTKTVLKTFEEQEDFLVNIAVKLGLNREELQTAFDVVKGTAQQSLGELLNIIQANMDNALSVIDERIKASQERINDLNKDLEEQRKLKEQGYANDVTLLEKQLKEETDIQRKAQDERIALQKKQANQQLAIDAALQASQIGLSIAKLISQEASKGLIGIVTASAGIALILSLVAKAKQQAVQTDIPKFREGTEYLQGNSHEQGGVLIEAEGGERILSKKLNSKLKMSNEDLVDYALVGQNMSKKIASMAMAGQNDVEALEKANISLQLDGVKSAIDTAMEKNADRVIGYWKSRPVIIPTSNGTLAESYDGATKVRKKYRSL